VWEGLLGPGSGGSTGRGPARLLLKALFHYRFQKPTEALLFSPPSRTSPLLCWEGIFPQTAVQGLLSQDGQRRTCSLE
jgi:hypothetical protein